jgi:hypothetical protein
MDLAEALHIGNQFFPHVFSLFHLTRLTTLIQSLTAATLQNTSGRLYHCYKHIALGICLVDNKE